MLLCESLKSFFKCYVFATKYNFAVFWVLHGLVNCHFSACDNYGEKYTDKWNSQWFGQPPISLDSILFTIKPFLELPSLLTTFDRIEFNLFLSFLAIFGESYYYERKKIVARAKGWQHFKVDMPSVLWLSCF